MRWIWLLLCLALPSHAAQITFAWDAQPDYPQGVTYELQANGVTAAGITGTSYTLSVPDGPGQPLTAQVRAKAAGYTESPWATFAGYVPGATVPNAVVNLRAANTQTGGGGVMAAPTYSATTQSNSPVTLGTAHTSATRTTPSYSPAANTVLVGVAASEDAGSGNKPISSISGGPTWTQQYLNNTTAFCGTALYTATADGGSITSTVTSSQSTNFRMGLAVLQFTGSDGIGNKNTANGTTGFPSVGLTTTQDNSAVVMLVTDWSAITGTSTFSTVNTTPVEVVDYADGANYGVHVAYWPDVGAAGPKTFAMSAPSGMKWIAQVIEVKGTSGGSTASGAGYSAGASAVAAVSAATSERSAIAAAIASASGVGASTVSSFGASAGRADVIGAALGINARSAIAAGSGVAASVGASTVSRAGSAMSWAFASGSYAISNVQSAYGSALGGGYVSGDGRSTAAAVGSSLGQSANTGVGGATIARTGSAASWAFAVGEYSTSNVQARAASALASGFARASGISTASAPGVTFGSAAVRAAGASTAARSATALGAAVPSASGASTHAWLGSARGWSWAVARYGDARRPLLSRLRSDAASLVLKTDDAASLVLPGADAPTFVMPDDA